MENPTFSFWGETAALSAAFLWALASVFYSRIGQYLSPLKMNLLKNVIAIAMTFAALIVNGNPLLDIDIFAFTLLLLSGAIGIGMGDTFFFGALRDIGPRRALLIMILAPAITGVLAYLTLGESLSVGAWLGIFITTAGVSWVITERTPAAKSIGDHKQRGILLAVGAAFGQAAGAVLSHAAFLHVNLSPMRSALIRLVGGALVVSMIMPFRNEPGGKGYGVLNTFHKWRLILLTVFIGTFLGIWLQQISLKFAAAGIAQTLFSTSPLFVIPIVIISGERVSLRAFLGVIIAISGVGFLFGMQ